ncbi:MAG: hypothetical protein MZU97_25040 [Bacillus subtilis]|nr:hypothetical protein [Bacillus subtilis]
MPGMGVAMANAKPIILKANVNYITLSNIDDGFVQSRYEISRHHRVRRTRHGIRTGIQ